MLRRSSMRKLLTRERATLLKFGPVMMFLPADPRKPSAGAVKAAGLNQRSGEEPPVGVKETPDTRLGRAEFSSVASRSGSPSIRTEKGTPELNDTMLLI